MELSEDAEFCAGFEAEAKAMARLNDPNLIGVHDFGEVNGMLYIVMEFVPGKSIYHSAHDQAIDPGEVIRLLTSICDERKTGSILGFPYLIMTFGPVPAD